MVVNLNGDKLAGNCFPNLHANYKQSLFLHRITLQLYCSIQECTKTAHQKEIITRAVQVCDASLNVTHRQKKGFKGLERTNNLLLNNPGLFNPERRIFFSRTASHDKYLICSYMWKSATIALTTLKHSLLWQHALLYHYKML